MRSRQTETEVKVEIERRSDSRYLNRRWPHRRRRLFKKAVQQGRRSQETGGVFYAIRRGFLGTENDAEASRSFVGVEWHYSDRLLDHFFEVVDRAYEGILELDLRLPFQKSTGSRDIRPSDFGIIGRQRIVRNLAR
jgi:hypothetical protein